MRRWPTPSPAHPRALACALFGMALARATASWAEEVSPEGRLERARVCLAALDLECASREAEALATQVQGLDPKARQEALRVISEVRLATGRKAEALQSLVSLLDLAPDWSPPEGAWPPAWLEVLDQARRLAPDRLPPAIHGLEWDPPTPGRPLTVRVLAEDPSGVGGVSVHRAIPGSAPVSLATTDGRTWTGILPPEWVEPPEVRLYVEARDTLGNGPSRLGSPDAPRTVPVPWPPAPPSRPVLEQWWFWTAVGLGAAAFGAGIYAMIRQASSESSTASSVPNRGNVRVEVLWPSRSE